MTNALSHLGKQYVLKLDLADFFDSITIEHVRSRIPPEILIDVLLHGSPKQGLPSSPFVANVAMLDIDKSILSAIRSIPAVTYSRYADDLTFGADDPDVFSVLSKRIQVILESKGLRVNSRKTRVQALSGGRIVITGIALSEVRAHPTRKTLRKLRAALHQDNKRSAEGLSDWAKCSLPLMLREQKAEASYES